MKPNIINRVKSAVQAFSGDTAKQTNSAGSDAVDFLRFGPRNRSMVQDWSQVEMSDEDMYTGYSYAAINKRANRAAALGKRFLYTEATPSMMEAAKKKGESVEHPYLELIRKSKEFSQRKFWHDISTYLDLEGVYYLMAVRAISVNQNGDVKVGKVQKFTMLNPYNVHRIIRESDGTVGGYIESRNGLYREIPKEMIIEIRLLNPFDNDKAYSMTDAAKESQFTIKQAGDYTRHSMKGNIHAPGVISTEVQLEDHIFDNFVARMQNHTKGEPVYGNGSGAVKWESMQIDLDNAALDKINEIHRSTLFAVSGTSKTTLGIEESGTTRDTSQVQKDNFTEDSVMPQIEDIIDAMNLDYRQWYSEWEQNEYEIVLDNPLESDREAELKDIEIRESELGLRDDLVAAGYEYEIAAKYAHGEISLEELGEPTLEPEITPEQADAMAAQEMGLQQGNPSQQNPNEPKDQANPEPQSVADNSISSVNNKFVPKEHNEKVMKEARKRLKDRLKAEKDVKKTEKPDDVKPDDEEKQEDVPEQKVKVEVEVKSDKNFTKAVNQVAARDIPDLYDDLEIDPRAVNDDNYRGCIMMNTEKIPVTQYIKNGDKDLVHETDRHDHTMGAVSEVEPHTTLFYGLLNNGNVWKNKVDQVLEGWSMDTVKINEVSYFDLPDSYAVIALLETTEELLDAHGRLGLLPNVSTFSEYHPHITLAYINKDADVEKWVNKLGKKYNGQLVATTGLNYGDLPEDNTETKNHIEDEHDMSKNQKVCKCCHGFGEHNTGFECYGCDATGMQNEFEGPFPCDGREDSPNIWIDDDGSYRHMEEKSSNASTTPVEHVHSHEGHEHDIVPNSTLDKALNELDPSIKDQVILQETDLERAVSQLESDVAKRVIELLRQGDIDEAKQLISQQEEDGFIAQLAVIIAAYYTVLFPIYAAQLFAARLAQFNQQGAFAMTDEVESYIKEAAQRAAESHMQTILSDFATAVEEATDKATRDELIKLVQDKVNARDEEYTKLLPDNPNPEDIKSAVNAGKFDKHPAYKEARDLTRQGLGLDAIAKSIRDTYAQMSETRAKTIAKHESSRVFNMSQYQADLQFLTETDNLNNAYKRLRSRTGNPCAVCALLIKKTRLHPIPFTQNFADLGDELTATYKKPNGKTAVQKIPINYEAIAAGNIHVNCNCEYELVIKKDGKELNDIRFIDGKSYNDFDPLQPRDSDGKWTDGAVGATKSVVMSEKEALEATKDSKYKKRLYHGTTGEFGSLIGKEGFKIKENGDRWYGDGIYLTPDGVTAQGYAVNRDQESPKTVSMYIDAKSIYGEKAQPPVYELVNEEMKKDGRWKNGVPNIMSFEDARVYRDKYRIVVNRLLETHEAVAIPADDEQSGMVVVGDPSIIKIFDIGDAIEVGTKYWESVSHE